MQSNFVMVCEFQGLKIIFKCFVIFVIMNMYFLYICNFVKYVEICVEFKGNYVEVYEYDVNCYVEFCVFFFKLFLCIFF